MIYALSHALELILKEGLENRFKRHRVLAGALRKALHKLNLQLVADQGCAADTITAVHYPKGVNDRTFRSIIAQRGIIVAGGLGSLAGKIFRIGHMGNITSNDILATIGAVEIALKELSYRFKQGVGLQAAQEALLSSFQNSCLRL